MPTCCVLGCTSGYRNDTSRFVRRFFAAPRNENQRSAGNWAIARADKNITAKSKHNSVEDDKHEASAPSFNKIESAELPPSWQRITVENDSSKFATFFTLKLERKALRIDEGVVTGSG
ncbi:hypothetical protein HPB51_015551 [Rhipicephalus microplus]|uniref:Uncharacterized protein n=1 Tax=Rhipicephalus microplus TaxID=6941 RepID=A0A9J6EGV0_RHIMP|nr:hypothetical protein HPB51_015551 [Rhipicephalus microplus]